MDKTEGPNTHKIRIRPVSSLFSVLQRSAGGNNIIFQHKLHPHLGPAANFKGIKTIQTAHSLSLFTHLFLEMTQQKRVK